MHPARIDQRLPVQRFRHGQGFDALGVRGDTATLDPFLMIDHYRMSEPTFGVHPHAGFSAVTYMFDDAETGFINRDSLGDRSTIRPGDLHWTIAGAGVLHDEAPLDTGRTAHGLQLFVNLPAAQKWRPPQSLHLDGERMPRVIQPGGAEIKVVFGEPAPAADNAAPPFDIPVDTTLLDVRIASFGSFDQVLVEGHTALLLVIAGSVLIGGEVIAAGEAVAFDRSGGLLVVTARPDAGPAHIALLMGQPLNEPVLRQGPFAMASQDDLERVIANYRAGRFGTIREPA